MLKKEMGKASTSNDLGVVGVTLGVLSIPFALIQPIVGIIIAIVGLVFSLKQGKVMKNKWSKAGVILNILGIILAIIVFISVFYFIRDLANNPELLAQLQGQGIG